MDSLFDPGSIEHQRCHDKRLQSVSRFGSGSAPVPHRGPPGGQENAPKTRLVEAAKTFLLSDPFSSTYLSKKCAACSCFKCQDLLLLLSSWPAGPRGAGPGLRSRFPESSSRLLTGARVLAPSRCEERRPRVGVGWLEEPVNSS